MTTKYSDILTRLEGMNEQELRRLLAFELTEKPLGLVWERDAIEHDRALNANAVLPRVSEDHSHLELGESTGNLIIEGDNFDALRLLRKTHAGKIRVIYIDPPYNTGSKDWVYNDDYVSKTDRYRQSKWLEFLYQRLELARDLLTNDGVILISINDENRANLELLMDKVMPGRRLGSMVWRSRSGGHDTKGAFLSTNHEHVLVYGNPNFAFSGEEKSYSIYTHEEDGRLFYLSDLTKAHNMEERPNTYYPIIDPSTGIHYPCSPNRVWAYATKGVADQKTKLRGATIEQMINDGEVWFPSEQRVNTFESVDALRRAIKDDDVPYSGKTALLWEGMPDLEAWVGVPIGYGRPRLKKFKDNLKNERSPISSWLTPKKEGDTVDPTANMPIVGGTDEGSRQLRALVNKSSFPYPKPPSLITALLSQSSRDDDIVLDFFAGSGTTGEVVLRLNQQDGGSRRYILCSNTEATSKAPNKNLCRDVCAERMRAVSDELKAEDGLKRPFAYLTLDLLEEADLDLDASHENAQALLSMRDTGQIQLPTQGDILTVGGNDQTTILVCRKVNGAVVEELVNWPAKRLIVYSGRPETLSDELPPDTAIECRALSDVYAYTKPSYRPAEVC